MRSDNGFSAGENSMKQLAWTFLGLLAMATAAVAQDMPLTADGPIGPRDRIEVHVAQDPTLNTNATVADDGRVALPLLGKVALAGLTPAQAETLIKGELESKYMNKADVTVQ